MKGYSLEGKLAQLPQKKVEDAPQEEKSPELCSEKRDNKYIPVVDLYFMVFILFILCVDHWLSPSFDSI